MIDQHEKRRQEKAGKQYRVLSAIYRMARTRKFKKAVVIKLLNKRAKYSEHDAKAIASIWFRYPFKDHETN